MSQHPTTKMKPLPIAEDFSHLYSIQTKTRVASPLETSMSLFYDPDIVFLGSGLPMSKFFPWRNVQSECPLPPFSKGISAMLSGQNIDTCLLKIERDTVTIAGNTEDIPLARSLQYGFGKGPPEFLSFVKEHTAMIHNMQYADWDIALTVGNSAGWDSTLRVFCDRGDSILAEMYSYSPTIGNAKAQGVNIIPLPMDKGGIVPQRLDDILRNWDANTPFPKLLYTIPVGQNPTAVSLSEERKVEIYKLAQKYDFIIVEDDPYYFFQMEPYVQDLVCRKGKHFTSHDEFISSLVKSFVSLDTDGRVIRLESLSKLLGPGTRLGWVVGAKDILEKFQDLNETTVLSPSGFSLSIVSGTLNRWGQGGYLDWLIGLRREYTEKRNAAFDALNWHMPKNSFVEFYPPTAGMFFSVIVDASAHPDFDTKFHSNTEELEHYLYEKFVSAGVLIFPSQFFKVANNQPASLVLTDSQHASKKMFFRGTYAAVSNEKTHEGIQRLGKVLQNEFVADY